MTEHTQEIREVIASQETASRASARKTSKLRRWLAGFIALGVVLVFVLIAADRVAFYQLRDDVRASLEEGRAERDARDKERDASNARVADAAANIGQTFEDIVDAIKSGNADIRKLRRAVNVLNESVRSLQQASQRPPTIVFPRDGGDPQIVFPTPPPAPPPPGPAPSEIEDDEPGPTPTPPPPDIGEDLICILTLECIDVPLDQDASAQDETPSLLDLLLKAGRRG